MSDHLLDKLNSQDVEKTILGVCLAFPDRIPVAKQASGDDWFGEHRWRLMDTMLKMHDAGVQVNVLSVHERLHAEGVTDWDVALLSSLTDGLPKSTNLEHYVDQLRTLGDKRRLLNIAVTAPTEAIVPLMSAEDAAQKMIDAIRGAVQGGTEDVTKIDGDLIEKALTPPDQHDLADLGIPGLDAKLGQGLRRGEILTVSARPSHGKTAFALAVTAHAAAAGQHICFVSMEMGAEELVQRLISARSHTSLSDLRMGQISQTAYESAMEIEEWPVDILERAASVQSVQRYLLRNPHTRMVVIDYVQLMDSGDQAKKYGSRVAEVAEISRSLKLLAKEHAVSILLLCQLNRQVEQRGDQRPRLSDLRESGSLEQDSDSVLGLYRPCLSPAAKDDPQKENCEPWRLNAYLLKNRQGPVGEVTLRFDTFSQRIVEWADEAGPDTGDGGEPAAANAQDW